jgi:TfoX/Sxy family transcriptional regulator of competence genes
MAYNENLAERVRQQFSDRGDVAERKMFGGLAFLVRGHMCCGIVGDESMVRIGPEAYEATLRHTAVFRCVRPEIFHICNISYHTAVSRCPQLLHCSITQAKA